MCPLVEELKEFYIDGDPAPEWNNSHGELPAGIYSQLIPDAPILPENLRRSYSGLCLAGRVAGESHTRNLCASIRFRDQGPETALDQLLAVHGWSKSVVSRVSFFNARTLEFDRACVNPSLAVADGDVSFLRIMTRTEFSHGDVIAVVDRTMERDRLEAVGHKLSDLSQWYVPDSDLVAKLPPAPRGISVAILRRR